jgi:alkaline phosphatase D
MAKQAIKNLPFVCTETEISTLSYTALEVFNSFNELNHPRTWPTSTLATEKMRPCASFLYGMFIMKKTRFIGTAIAALLFSIPAFSQQTKTGVVVPKKTPESTQVVKKAPEVVAPEAVKASALAEDIENTDVEAYKPKAIDTSAAPSVIAFGSCNKLNLGQSHWAGIAANQPNLWVWLGDIIYADTSDMRALAAHYKKLKTFPDYKKMRAKTQVMGVYDDHDYGINDGCRDYPMKRGAKKCLMDFMDVPMNSPQRKREGAYISYTFGKGAQSVKVIVMDTRYFRDPLKPDPSKQKRYLPNTTGTMLGETQWKWLERELRTSKANLNILCSSVQVISDEHPHEKWGNFPNERKRLLSLIASAKPKNLLILSGDRHMAEVSKMPLEGLSYPLYDFTSSGLTHTRNSDAEANKYRVGDMIVKKNFGLLKITWQGDKPMVTLQARGPKNELYQEMVVKY